MSKRELANQAMQKHQECSQRKASSYFKIHRSTLRYQAKQLDKNREQANKKVVELSLEHPELGAKKIGVMTRKEGYQISTQRVRKTRKQEGLEVPARKAKKRRGGTSTGVFPQKASHRNHVWSWDFVHDHTVKGGNVRMLSILDEYTRECHSLESDRRIGSSKVLEILADKINRYGEPEYIRSDNGSEFIARHVQEWLKENGIQTLYIDPGSPWQNGYVESFHDKLRRECLDRHIFYTLTEFRVLVEEWRKKYNEVRPHMSLGMRTPKEFALELLSQGPPTCPQFDLPCDESEAPFSGRNLESWTSCLVKRLSHIETQSNPKKLVQKILSA